ncbi:hypothetical protein ACSMXN_09255 [Jatrophihabitans sp. DSM 45814]
MPVEANEQFTAAAKALNEAADKTIRTEVYAAFRRAAKPLGESIIREGSAELPHRGGLAARVAKAKLAQSNATTGNNPKVAISLKVREGYSLKSMDAGTIRHPVFSRADRTQVWVKQSIRSGAFTRPFEAGADPVRKEVLTALENVARQIRDGTARGAGTALGNQGG